MPTETTLAQVRTYRWRAHQLDRPAGSADDCDVLDLGVQDTGHDGAAWALRNRGCPTTTPDVSLAWTLRGAPHLYRTAQLAEVAVATAPFSEPDAAKRVMSAAKPLKAAGIDALTALREVAERMRELGAEPIAKGAMSTALTAALPEAYLRYCRPCGATHPYEMLVRLAALHGGLRLQPGTSPPVLEPVPGWSADPYAHLAGSALPGLDAIRNYLRFFGPATIKQVAEYLDCPVKDVREHWPADAVEVAVLDNPSPQPRFLLAADLDRLDPDGLGSDALGSGGLGSGGPDSDRLDSGPSDADPRYRATGGDGAVRLLGPYDPYLQLRDREVLVPDASRRKTVWLSLGRPGAIARDGDLVGLWRPKAAGRRLSVRVERWDGGARDDALAAAIEQQARDLAEYRSLEFDSVDYG